MYEAGDFLPVPAPSQQLLDLGAMDAVAVVCACAGIVAAEYPLDPDAGAASEGQMGKRRLAGENAGLALLHPVGFCRHHLEQRMKNRLRAIARYCASGEWLPVQKMRRRITKGKAAIIKNDDAVRQTVQCLLWQTEATTPRRTD